MKSYASKSGLMKIHGNIRKFRRGVNPILAGCSKKTIEVKNPVLANRPCAHLDHLASPRCKGIILGVDSLPLLSPKATHRKSQSLMEAQ